MSPTHITVTLYYSPEQELLHTIISEVWTDSGKHTVKASELRHYNTAEFKRLFESYQALYDEANVRAYTVTEVK